MDNNGLFHLLRQFAHPTDGVGIPSPSPGRPSNEDIFSSRIRRHCFLSPGWGKGTPTPSVGFSFLAQTVVKDEINRYCPGPLRASTTFTSTTYFYNFYYVFPFAMSSFKTSMIGMSRTLSLAPSEL